MTDPITPDAICQLPPGRDLNARVARALGNVVEFSELHNRQMIRLEIEEGKRPLLMEVPGYADESAKGWAAMRECVEWLRGKRDNLVLTFVPRANHWVAEAFDRPDQSHLVEAWQPTLPHAVALLVLLVKHAEESTCPSD